MTEFDNALSQVHEIQARLAESTRFRGIGADLNVFTAALALCAALAQVIWPQVLQPDPLSYIAVWLVVLVLSTLAVCIDAVFRARRLHGSMAGMMLSGAAHRTLPYAAAAVIITCVICGFARESVLLLPGLWQLLIGLLGFSVVRSLPREILWASAWYFFCGSVVLVLAAYSGRLDPWMMGLPLVVGQAAVALILNRAERGGAGD